MSVFKCTVPADIVRDYAKEYCRLTGLAFVAVSGDGWLDVTGQRDISPYVWFTQLQNLTGKYKLPWESKA
jgi:hypothetical protein